MTGTAIDAALLVVVFGGVLVQVLLLRDAALQREWYALLVMRLHRASLAVVRSHDPAYSGAAQMVAGDAYAACVWQVGYFMAVSKRPFLFRVWNYHCRRRPMVPAAADLRRIARAVSRT